MCGQSSVCDNEHDYAEQFLSGSNLILRKHKRTENNVFLLLGDEYCVQNYNFVNDFTVAMTTVQEEANFLSKIDDNISSMERELEIVQTSSGQMQKRLNDRLNRSQSAGKKMSLKKRRKRYRKWRGK